MDRKEANRLALWDRLIATGRVTIGHLAQVLRYDKLRGLVWSYIDQHAERAPWLADLVDSAPTEELRTEAFRRLSEETPTEVDIGHILLEVVAEQCFWRNAIAQKAWVCLKGRCDLQPLQREIVRLLSTLRAQQQNMRDHWSCSEQANGLMTLRGMIARDLITTEGIDPFNLADVRDSTDDMSLRQEAISAILRQPSPHLHALWLVYLWTDDQEVFDRLVSQNVSPDQIVEAHRSTLHRRNTLHMPETAVFWIIQHPLATPEALVSLLKVLDDEIQVSYRRDYCPKVADALLLHPNANPGDLLKIKDWNTFRTKSVATAIAGHKNATLADLQWAVKACAELRPQLAERIRELQKVDPDYLVSRIIAP
jgi:hypothetical protein